jgi:hypothetical protein
MMSDPSNPLNIRTLSFYIIRCMAIFIAERRPRKSFIPEGRQAQGSMDAMERRRIKGRVALLLKSFP